MPPMNVATQHSWLAFALIYIETPKPPSEPRFMKGNRIELIVYVT